MRGAILSADDGDEGRWEELRGEAFKKFPGDGGWIVLQGREETKDEVLLLLLKACIHCSLSCSHHEQIPSILSSGAIGGV